MPNTDKSSAEHRNVLENEKNSYGKVSINQYTALMNTRTLKNACNKPKQWETRLNGKIKQK